MVQVNIYSLRCTVIFISTPDVRGTTQRGGQTSRGHWSRGLYCFQPKGGPPCLMRRAAGVSLSPRQCHGVTACRSCHRHRWRCITLCPALCLRTYRVADIQFSRFTREMYPPHFPPEKVGGWIPFFSKFVYFSSIRHPFIRFDEKAPSIVLPKKCLDDNRIFKKWCYFLSVLRPRSFERILPPIVHPKNMAGEYPETQIIMILFSFRIALNFNSPYISGYNGPKADIMPL